MHPNFRQLLLYGFFGILSLSFGCARAQGSSFKHETLSSGSLYNETKIRYLVDNQEVGYISITKAPLVPFYILHTFYIHPQYRNKGHGTLLLTYSCQQAKSLGANRIYIQPGPFELDINGHLFKPIDTHNQRVHALIALYQKCGFTAASKPLAYCAHILYMCMGIDENAEYLMVKI